MLKKQDVHPSLKVRIKRLFLYFFLTFLGILLVFIILVMNNISKSLENESELFSSLVSSIVESDSESIKILAQDYSLWDDMYYYVQNQNKEFENKYLKLSSKIWNRVCRRLLL